MSSPQPSMSSLGLSNSAFDEHRWVIHISQSLDGELDDEDSLLPVSIFNVPKALMASDPDCYVPQMLVIGPYHYWNPELYEMQRYKLAAAKRTQKQLQNRKFQHLVEKLNKSEPKIRACYHKFLNFSGETLGWMMAVDACFLLEFLQAYNTDQVDAGGAALPKFPSRMGHLLDVSGRKSIHNAILRDIVKLENQVPLFLLRNVLEFKLSSLELADRMLLSMLSGVLAEVSPFKMPEALSGVKIADCAHLLDFLYRYIVYGLEDPSILRVLKVPLESLLCGQADEKPEDSESNNKPPLMEDITIPSVTELSEAGIRFSPTSGGISSISFDEKTVTLYLPAVSLDVNSEVILRNLVAYEACNASGPLVLARYTEFMNGIIDTEEDAMVFRQKGIIVSRLKRDEKVAELWNGMNKSVKLTKVPYLEKVIEDVNRYYNGKWKIKAKKFFKVYVFGSWKILTLLATIMLLLLMTLQAFCTVYSCPRIFHTVSKSS